MKHGQKTYQIQRLDCFLARYEELKMFPIGVHVLHLLAIIKNKKGKNFQVFLKSNVFSSNVTS